MSALVNGRIAEPDDGSVKATTNSPDLRLWWVRADGAANAHGEYRWYEGGYRSGQRPCLISDEPQRWDEMEGGQLVEVYGELVDGDPSLHAYVLAEVERINR